MIVLTPQEMMAASLVGTTRQIKSLTRKQTAGHPATKDWQHHIEGALGECAFAKLAGRYWGYSVGTFHQEGDVAGIEVKTRSWTGPDLRMIIRPDEPGDRVYVLMSGINGRYEYRGWILGSEGKRTNWLSQFGPNDTRPACYCVPVTYLTPTMPEGIG